MTAPRRHSFRFRFSMRLLMLLVAIAAACCWPLSDWRIVQRRKAVLLELQQAAGGGSMVYLVGTTAHPGWSGMRPAARMSYIRRQFGDESYSKISIPLTVDAQMVERVVEAFPEAEIEVDLNQKVYLFQVSR